MRRRKLWLRRATRRIGNKGDGGGSAHNYFRIFFIFHFGQEGGSCGVFSGVFGGSLI